MNRLQGFGWTGSRLSTGLGVKIRLVAGGVSILSWSISTLLLTVSVMGEMLSTVVLEVLGWQMYKVNLSVGGRSPKELINVLRPSSSMLYEGVERGRVCL